MSQYVDKDGASRIAENFLSKQAEQDAILKNLQFDLKEAEHALVKTVQGPAPLNIRALTRPLDDYVINGNTLQDGTPTPEAPVDVVGCGAWGETQQSYKLPITVNGTEYPIYLGQVPTTRSIRKLVLMGEEDWTVTTSANQASILLPAVAGNRTVFSTHYKGIVQAVTGNAWINATLDRLFIMDTANAIDLTVFKSYLAEQYESSTPVMVWYVLAEPETGIVNEPLMKIGEYADTISMEQSGVEISTTKGFNTITTDTIVLPSNIEVKGVINNA
jgi:hypothetical protein